MKALSNVTQSIVSVLALTAVSDGGEGQVILVRRKDGTHGLPWDHLRSNEDPTMAAHRVLRVQAGYESADVALVRAHALVAGSRLSCHNLIAMRCRKVGGSQMCMGEYHAELKSYAMVSEHLDLCELVNPGSAYFLLRQVGKLEVPAGPVSSRWRIPTSTRKVG